MVNIYVCDLCGDWLVTIDRDAGVTPFLMPCQAPIHRPERLGQRSAVQTIFDRKRSGFGNKSILRMPDGTPITARSVAYRIPPFIGESKATVEFYRPPYNVYSQMKAGSLRDHVSNGGLLFRGIKDKGITELNQIEGME